MRSISTLMILSLLIVAFMAMSAFGASAPTPSKRASSTLADKMVHYSFPDEGNYSPTSSGQKPAGQSLGLANPPEGSLSPGYKIGDTWYDYQHNGTMGRMVDWGYDATYGYLVHFTWMRMNQSAFTARHFAYTAYIANTNTVPPVLGLQGSEEYAGYCGLDARDGAGGVVVGGHNNPGGGYAPHFYYETGVPGEGTFDISFVSDPPLCEGLHDDHDYCPIWPKFRYQEVPGQTPVTHVFAQEARPAAGDPQAISYFRKVGEGATGTWDPVPFVVDTVSDIAQDIACSNTDGKVALVWAANGCPDLSVCDTCSDNTDSYNVVNGQWENDAYYQISTNYGVSWGPRFNMTKHHHEDDFWLVYTDMTCLIDSDNNLHVGYAATRWGMEEGSWTALGYNDECRLLHWSETIGTENTLYADGRDRAKMQIVADLVYDEQTAIDKQCISGAWNVAGAKMTVSECNGRLYFLWVQFQDPVNDVYDDCAQRAWEGTTSGSANGELMLAVSTGLQGCLWDGARNLTNSYTPHCDSVGGENGRCDSDNWPSMARFGSNHATPLLDDSVIVNPGGGTAHDGWYLPVQYVSDRDAGGIVQDEGTWKMADIAWFQLACSPPVPTKTVVTSYNSINFPAWVNDAQGGTVCTLLTLQNIGNENATAISTSTNVTSGHPAGALTADHGVFDLDAGCDATLHEGDICMGNGLISSAGAPQELIGTVVFTGAFDNSPKIVPINFFIADTVYMQVWDTIYCDDGTKAHALALTIGNNGNYGDAGEGEVNLDYFAYGDCAWYDTETESNPYLGNARVYLYDGSPIICWDEGGTIKCNYSMFDIDFASVTGDVRGFFPQADPPQAYPDWMTPNNPVDADLHVAEFVNLDTTIKIEQVTIAPNVEDPHFMIQAVKYTNLTGSPITGLAIGEGIDWDVPSDSSSQNRDGYVGAVHLMYQVGEEYGQDDLECVRNNTRYGGLAVIEMYEDGVLSTVPERGIYCMDNATQVYPEGHFPPDSLWEFMGNKTGFTRADSSQFNDLHMIGTYRWDHTLAADGGSFVVYTIKITGVGISGELALAAMTAEALAWYDANFKPIVTTCCVYVGDVNHDGAMDGVPLIDDLVYMVTFMFQNDLLCELMCDDDDTPGCNNGDVAILPETDINGDGTGIPDIADLVYLVNYMFQGQPQPPAWDDYDTPACNPGPFK